MIPVHTSILLDTRRALKDSTFPVKLRITYQRQRKYYNTNYSLTETDFAKTQAEKPKGKFKEMRIAFQAIEQRALGVIDQLSVFDFERFEKKFLSRSARDEVFSTYEQQIQQLKADGQVGTASTYESAYFSFLSYTLKEPLVSSKGVTLKDLKTKKEELLSRKKPLLFSAVTIDFLSAYEKWMISRGKSLTSVSMYVRTLRTLFNDVIATGDVNQDLYPFGKRKYQVPAGNNVKKALVLSDIKKIFNYKAPDSNEAKARDLWVFSYLCNGINIKDIARLKYKQLDADRIAFIRAKTERTTRHDLKTISAIRTAEIDSIIDRWGTKPIHPESFVFPILKPGLTAEEERAKVQQATKTINKYIKRVAEAVGIEKKVTTYTARHSFSTVLKRAGAPIEFISESLGHSSTRTTASYLDSFEDNVKRQYTAHLTAFKTTEN